MAVEISSASIEFLTCSPGPDLTSFRRLDVLIRSHKHEAVADDTTTASKRRGCKINAEPMNNPRIKTAPSRFELSLCFVHKSSLPSFLLSHSIKLTTHVISYCHATLPSKKRRPRAAPAVRTMQALPAGTPDPLSSMSHPLPICLGCSR